MQMFIALAPTILLCLTAPWLASIYRKLSRATNTSQGKLPVRSHIKQAAVLMSMLVEFQEAQCFFMLATQIAVLISFRNQSKFYEPENSAQLDMDNYLGQLIGAAGLIPVSIVMFTLNNGGMNSWYILFLSGITLAISSATVILSTTSENFGDNGAEYAGFYELPTLQACGNHPPPIVFCDTVWFKSTNLQGFLQDVLAYIYIGPIIIFSIILIQFLLSLPLVSHKGRKLLPRLYRLEGSKMAKILDGLWILLVSLFLLLATYVYLANLYYIAYFGAIDAGKWTLGQIVAVTIWAPVICKYMYSAICKSILSVAYPYHTYVSLISSLTKS